MLVTAPPFVPAKTISGYSGIPELLDDSRHVAGADAQPVAVVDRDHRCPAAAAEALDRAEDESAVLGRGASGDSEFALERLHDLLRAGERAGDVRAYLDPRAADRLEVVLVVEGGDRAAVR